MAPPGKYDEMICATVARGYGVATVTAATTHIWIQRYLSTIFAWQNKSGTEADTAILVDVFLDLKKVEKTVKILFDCPKLLNFYVFKHNNFVWKQI